MRIEQLFQRFLVECDSLTTRRWPTATPLEVRGRRITAVLLLAGLLVSPAARADADPGTTEQVSVSSAGKQGFSVSAGPSLSADGRFVAFESDASNLVPGETNQTFDVFVHDRQTGTTERVSVSSAGKQGNGLSAAPSLSADGRFLAFISAASNLVRAGDTNQTFDVFVHDRQTGTTERVSVSSAGTQGNGSTGQAGLSLSADGRCVAFQSFASNLVPGDTNGLSDVFVHDRETGTTERVSVDSFGTEGNNVSWRVSISADCRLVAFQSFASNLVPGDTNGVPDVFVHDRWYTETHRVSVDSAGTQGNASSEAPSISADGRFVAFQSLASNLVPGDTNQTWDVFVRDLETGTTERVSVSSAGTQGNNNSSGFRSLSISADGRFVAFHSFASNLVRRDTNLASDVFVHDRQTGTTERVSVDSAGTQGNDGSEAPSLSADGRFVAFQSLASNLVPGDTNQTWDVFVHDRGNPAEAEEEVDDDD